MNQLARIALPASPSPPPTAYASSAVVWAHSRDQNHIRSWRPPYGGRTLYLHAAAWWAWLSLRAHESRGDDARYRWSATLSLFSRTARLWRTWDDSARHNHPSPGWEQWVDVWPRPAGGEL